MDSATTKVFGREPIAVTPGQAVVIDARGMAFLNILAGAGATAAVTRVNARGRNNNLNECGPATAAAVYPAASSSTVTIAGDGTAVAVDWPFYRVDVTGGSAITYVVLV